MSKTIAGTILVVFSIILINVYARGGTPAVRSWFSAKFLNRPFTRPARRAS